MRGVNEQELWPLVLFAAEHRLPLRLIELMPLTRTDVLTEKNFLPVGEVMQLLGQRDELIPQPEVKIGHGPAKYFLLKQTGALVGFVGALTNLQFCESCNKMRLTADGKIRPAWAIMAKLIYAKHCANTVTIRCYGNCFWKLCV